MIPDDFRWHLSADILTEFITNTDHVKMTIHPCKYDTIGHTQKHKIVVIINNLKQMNHES